jgi:Holliday junction DNA helicase RuvB
MVQHSVYSGFPQEEDQVFERSLRPRSFDEFVGQRQIVENLKTWISGAGRRKEALDHALFCGPPGLGKTTLAYILASEMGVTIRCTSGPAITKARDLAGILTSLQQGDVLFIDEIHRIDARVEEYLYMAMEDFRISITIDHGPHSRTVTVPLKQFTLLGATTREGLLTPPLRSRFQIMERLDFYPPEELKQIIERSAKKLAMRVSDEAAGMLASCARGTPRVANRLLRRVRDVADSQGHKLVNEHVVADGLRRLGVDSNGLCELDRSILRALAQNPERPLGLKTISAVVGEQEDTIEEVYEPFLIRLGLLEKTARGRLLTPQGLAYLGLRPDGGGAAGRQNPLF